MNNIKQATSISSVTLLGIIENKFPLSHGNCFSIYAREDDEYYSIVNFYYENLEELIRQGLTWPIQIKILGIPESHIAVIHDDRISDEWYNDKFCTVCCPKNLLPINQQLLHERQELRGERIVRKNGDTTIVRYKIDDKKVKFGYVYSTITEVSLPLEFNKK
jgi:hypothetical protein